MTIHSHLLPILNHKSEIQKALLAHQTIIIAGDTGSGKTTQLPQFCLELDPTGGKLIGRSLSIHGASDTRPSLVIGCTQPRRVAAVSVAERVSEELRERGENGGLVGYKIRFHDQTSADTRIKFMTDGVLLAESRNDPQLRRYGVIIIDEAHERSLNIDFLLGFLKNLLPKRPDLKLIITSATIDTGVFARHFDQAPVLTIAGRTYPVEVRYSPMDNETLTDKDDYIDHCVQTMLDLYQRSGPRDTLIFLPTERDIRTCCELLAKKIPEAVTLPMFGRLQGTDQRRIFQQYKQCKIVVATNIAETSITVPGIRYVIDSGLARISQYNVRAKTISLPITRISRASCDQRQGRCGRTGPGICVRLFSEEDYLGREEFTAPEIKRANLAEVILQMIAFKLGDPHSFPFMEPPHSNTIRDGYKLLTELGAIDDQGKLTSHGRIMATLPIDPCISRIILAAQENNCLREVKVIAAALAIPDPRVRPADRAMEADHAHRHFFHPDSDFLSLLQIWDLFHDVERQTRSWSRLKKFCAGHFLSFQRMREWLDLYEQLDRILARHTGFSDNTSPASYTAIHQSLCTGFLRNIAVKQKERIYLGGGGSEVMIFPGSHLSPKKGAGQGSDSTGARDADQGWPSVNRSRDGQASGGQWIIAASFMETTRLYAMTVATIEQEWLEHLGGALCKRSWSAPRWHKKSGQVIADERVTLFGLVIVAGRKVNYGRIDPKNQAEARQIFIQSALMGGELDGPFPFLKKNLQLLEEWQDTEERLRKRDIVVDDRALHGFYEQRIPAHVYDRFTLNRFLQRQKDKQMLEMSETDILNRRPEERELSDFPPLLTVGSMQFRLEYHFAPGAEDDGVTVRIPLDMIDTLQEPFFEWLVPGLLKEKITLLLKGLPKAIRKFLIPLSGTVDMILDDLDMYKGSLLQGLERSILKSFRRTIIRGDWPTELPPHLSMRFLLFDQSGKEVAVGRSLARLREGRHQGGTSASRARLSAQDQKIKESWEERFCTTWDFAGLPPSLPLFSPEKEMCGSLFPALVPVRDRGGVVIEFVTSQAQAALQNREGLGFLYQLQVAEQYKSLKKYCATSLSGPSSSWLTHGLGERPKVAQAILSFIVASLFNTLADPVPGREAFMATVARVKNQDFYAAGRIICDTIMATLRQRRAVTAHIQRFADLARKTRSYAPERYADYKQLLEEILPLNFLETKTLIEIQRCDKEMKALMIRIERAYVDPAKDELKAGQLKPHLYNLQTLRKKEKDLASECLHELKKYEEMISRFRITLFAPEIQDGTQMSSKKLDQQWQEVERYY
ncbi:MAG: ATP-dependent RNA helicase HrpA [Desulfoarculaceae bacterium]|nr:ATP-dependent RNA helicase HrpA [Desulfoarculaceae bacterium]